MSDYWDTAPVAGGDYVRFADPGDKIVGEVIDLAIGRDFNGNPCPQITIRTEEGDDRIVTAGQVNLQIKLKEARPAVGDRIAIVYADNGEAKPGRNPTKLFDVSVKKAGANGDGDTTASSKPAADELV